MPRGPNMPDATLLEIMRLRDVERLSYAEIAARVGRTRNTVAGLLKRINDETDHFDKTPHLNVVQPWKRST